MTFATWRPEQAFAAYQAVRARLPRARFPGGYATAGSLSEIAEHYDVFLLDAFGILNVGETAVPGAPERVAELRRRGKRVLVLTNSASQTPAAALEKYRRLGFDFAPDEVVSSRDALKHDLSARSERLWGVMAPPTAGIEELGVPVVRLGDDPAPYDLAEGFVLLGSAGWTAPRQGLLAAALRRNPRAVLVGNPDIVAPREQGLTLEPGHFAHRLADEAAIEPVFFGKPFGNIFELAFGRVGPVDRQRVVMVGDTLHTDVLGGAAAGVRTALVSPYGLFRDLDAPALIAASGLVPDHLLSGV